jgi:hypothetical protein
MIETDNNTPANGADSQARDVEDSPTTNQDRAESANQTANDVVEWLGPLVKAEDDPTAGSYPEPPQLNRTTALEWLANPENSQWKGDKRAKAQEDFDTMDNLWMKVTKVKIHTRSQEPALRAVINSVCTATLDPSRTNQILTAAELCKIRRLTRVQLQPLLKNHLLNYEELTPWVDEFLRVYMPRAVFAWKNRLRQNRSKTPIVGADQNNQKETLETVVDPRLSSRAASNVPHHNAKRKLEASNAQIGPPRKTRAANIQHQTQHILSQQSLPFVRREIELSLEKTSEYAIVATAAIIEPAELFNDAVSASHLSFRLLQQIVIREGGDFANVGKTFEIWDPLERVSIKGDFQLRNAIGLQWLRAMYAEDQSVFRLEVRSIYKY